MKFEYWRSKRVFGSDQWYWHLKAANGKIVAQGEGYSTKENCLRTIGLVKATSNSTDTEEIQDPHAKK